MFSAGGGVRWLRLRLVPVHVPLNYREVVIHLIYGQQGNLRGNTNTPNVNHNTPGWGEQKERGTGQSVSKPGDYDQQASWLQSRRRLLRMDLSAVRPPEEQKTKRVTAKVPKSTAVAAGVDDARHLQPADVEEKLQQGEDRQEEVHVVTRVPLSWIQELTADQTGQEEAVDRHCHHLVTTENINLGPSDLH